MRKSISLLVVVAMVLSLFGGLGNLRTASAAPVVGDSKLQVRIITPAHEGSDGVPHTGVMVGDEFYVNATIANPTDAAIPTSAELLIDAGAIVLDTNPKALTIPAHGVLDVWWKVECTAVGTSTLTVTASGSSDDVRVAQYPEKLPPKIIVTIIEHPGDQADPHGRVPVSTNSVIKASVYNVSGEDLTGASATLVIGDGDPAELTNGDVPTIPLTSLASPFFYAGTTQIVAWNVHCTGEGSVLYTVTAAADGVLAEEVIDESVTVEQGDPEVPETPGHLTVELYSPEKVCTNCGEDLYTVKARICNHSSLNVYDVTATLGISDGSLATIQDLLTRPIGDFVANGTAPSAGTQLYPASDSNEIAFLDLNGNGAWDEGETLYFDDDNDLLVDAGDDRISAVTAYQAAVAPSFDSLVVAANGLTMAHDIANNTTISIATNHHGVVTSIVTNPVMDVEAGNTALGDFTIGTDLIGNLHLLGIGDDSAYAKLQITTADDGADNTSVIWLNEAASDYVAGSTVAVGDTDINTPLHRDILLMSTTTPWAPGSTVILDLVENTLYDSSTLVPGECRVVTWEVHPNIPGTVGFTVTATGVGGDPEETLTDTDTSTTEQKEIRTDLIAGWEVITPAGDGNPAEYQPIPLGDIILNPLAEPAYLLFPGDPLHGSGAGAYYDVDDDNEYDVGDDVAVNDATYPYGVYNPIATKMFQEVGDKFDITAFIDNCTCLAWPNVLSAITANGLPIPLTALPGDNVKWDSENMHVHIQKYRRAGGLEGDWQKFGSAYEIPVDALNPNGDVLDNSLCACCGIEITWHLECAAESTDEIVVTTSSKDNPAVIYDTASLTVQQGGAPCITTNVQFFKGWDSQLETAGICAALVYDPITMVIPVANIGGRAAEEIDFIVHLDGDYSTPTGASVVGASGSADFVEDHIHVHIHSLAAGASAKVIVQLTCSGYMDLRVTLLDGNGHSTITYLDTLDDKTPEELCEYPSSGTLVQVPLDITWINPAGETDQDPNTSGVQVEVSSKFAIKIGLTNNDEDYLGATAPGHEHATDLTGVTVTLHWGSRLGVPNGFVTEQPLVALPLDNHMGAEIWGTNQSIVRTLDGPLVHGTTEEVSWEMHCTSPGTVYFWIEVEAQAGTGDCYKVATTSDYHNDYNPEGIFEQIPAAHLTGEILSPSEYSVYATGSKFAVSATFTNDSDRVATNVVVGVFFGDDWNYPMEDQGAVVTSESPFPEFVSLGDMAQGESASITWEMQTIRPTRPVGNDDEVWIFYKGDNSYLEYTSLTHRDNFYVYPAARLVVHFDEVTNPTLGTDFAITGHVHNIGWADATDVVLSWALGYGDIAPAPGSGMTLPLGLVIAERDGDPQPHPFTLNLQAEQMGKAYLVLGIEGRDEYGYSHRVEQLFGSFYGFFQLPYPMMFEDFEDFIETGILPLAPIPAWATEVPDTLTFNVVETAAPVITPTAGQDGAIVNEPSFTLTGTVTDNIGVTSFYVGTTMVDLLPDGTFAYPVVLAVGANTFTYKAFDAALNMGTTSITVTYEVPVDPLLVMKELSYIAGWNLVTVPLDSTTLSGLAGDVNFTGEIYGYSQTAGWFIPTGFEAGQGYWLNMKAAGAADIYGYEVASPQLTSYAPGWVLIGSPYSVGGDTVRVLVDTYSPMLLEDAVVYGFVGNIYYFDGAWKSFDATTDAIVPGVGYWFEVKAGASIVFVKP